MEQLTLAMEMSRLALSQYKNFAFSSITKWGDKYIATASDGIYELEISQTDNGADIDARIDTLVTDFGANNQKRLRRVFVSGEFHDESEEQDKAITLYTKNDGGNERSFPLQIQSKDGKQVNAKADISRDGRGRHWQLRLESNGMDFSIDAIDLVVNFSHHKPSGI